MKTLRLALVAALCLVLGALPASGQIVPAPSSASPVVTLGSYSQVGVTGIIPLVGRVTTVGGGNDRYTTLGKSGTAVGYAVTAGKTLTIHHLIFECSVAATKLVILYGNTDVGENGAAAPTTPIYLASFANTVSPFIAAASSTAYSVPVFLSVPAGKYAAISNDSINTSCVVAMWGVEN